MGAKIYLFIPMNGGVVISDGPLWDHCGNVEYDEGKSHRMNNQVGR